MSFLGIRDIDGLAGWHVFKTKNEKQFCANSITLIYYELWLTHTHEFLSRYLVSQPPLSLLQPLRLIISVNVNETIGKIAVPGLGEWSLLKDEPRWESGSMNSTVLKGFCPWEQEDRIISVKCHKLKLASSHSFRQFSGKSEQQVTNLEGAMESGDLRDFVLYHGFEWSDEDFQLGA